MAEPVLKIDHLVSGYAKDAPIVRGISLDLMPGEILALFGPNGAGKSTLVKAVVGIAPVFDGAVFCDGRDVAGEPAHRIVQYGVGFVPQVANVFAELTVRENLELALAMRKRPGPSIAEVGELFPDLERFSRQFAGRLSGGQRQMVAIARALIGGPRVLILDEPSAGLSPANVGKVFERLRALTPTISILLVEQNVRAALSIANRAILLAEGTIRLDKPTADILSDRAVAQAFMGGAH